MNTRPNHGFPLDSSSQGQLEDLQASHNGELAKLHRQIDELDTPDLVFITYDGVGVLRAVSGDGQTELGRIAFRFGAELWATGRHGDLRLDGATATVTAACAPPLPGPAAGVRRLR